MAQFQMCTYLLTTLFVFTACSKKEADKTIPTVTNCVSESSLDMSSIVGGRKVHQSDSDANKAVMLLSRKEATGLYVCTSTPIAPNVLLTAAHCVTEDSGKTKAVLHTSLTCESGFNFDNDTVNATKIIIHPKYVRSDKTLLSNTRYDLALVFLSSPLPIKYQVYKIADPEKIKYLSALKFYGFGVTKADKDNSTFLRKVVVKKEKYQILKTDGIVRLDQKNSTGICSGDSGGSALIDIDGEDYILAVNSSVEGPKNDLCNDSANLALVSSEISWINQALKSGF